MAITAWSAKVLRRAISTGENPPGCARVTPAVTGEHNFDPAWSPDGDWIVFASTRAGGVSRKLFLPQSDLWRMRADGSAPLDHLANDLRHAALRDAMLGGHIDLPAAFDFDRGKDLQIALARRLVGQRF